MRARKRWIKILIIVFSFIVLLIAAALFLLFPKKMFQEPTGPYHVGTTTRYITDPSRSETFTADPNDYRELYLQIWYPAEDDDLPRTSYGTHMSELIAQMANNMDLPGFLFQHLKSVRTYSANDADLAEEDSAYPVILFSHGLGLYAFQNTFQMEELASHGYIVVAIQHPHHSLLTIFPDGRQITDQSYDLARFDQFIEMNKLVTEVWVKDAGSTLDYLEQINLADEDGRFVKRIDLANVGMLGHSIGGAAAAQALLLEPRVKAAINLDGTLTGTAEIPKTGFTKPFMQLSAQEFAGSDFMEADTDKVIAEQTGITTEELSKHAAFLDVFKANQTNAFANEGYYVWLKGASHYTFTDIALYSPLVPFFLKDKIDTKLAHRVVNEYTLNFFDRYLRNITSSLLQPSDTDTVKVSVGL